VEHYTKAGKVTFIDGNRDKEAVFVDSCAAVEQCVRGEVLATNQLLLDAICAGDWDAYAALVDPDLTCFEPEAGAEGLLRGLGVHRANFEEGAKGRAEGVMRGQAPVWMASTMMEAEARLMGPNHALVTYVRASSPLQGKEGAPVARVAESRVWRFTEAGRWTLMHVHRSPMPALEGGEGH
jgi:calcium/calmodulin-dependent protein kinase (CaM kinase) II